MKKIYSVLLVAFSLLAMNTTNAQDLIITGIFDGQPSWAANPVFPKGVELYAVNNITDLSIYGVGSANNGGGSDGEEFTFPAITATAGSYIYIASNAQGFLDFFGFAADYVDGVANINGDDAFELFQNGNVIDTYGDINTIGDGEVWDYTDGWGYRADGTGPDGTTFVAGNWTYSGIDQLDGATSNVASPTPMPIGTFQLTATPKVNISVATATVNEGDGTVTIGNLLIDPAVTANSSFQIHLKSGTGSSADFVGVTFPQTIPVTSAVTSLPITFQLNDDVVFEDDETIQFVLRNGTGDLSIGSDSLLLLTIIENDLPLDTTVNVLNNLVVVNEGDGTANMTFKISQNSANGNDFTVDLQLVSGSATDIGNYTTQTITFSPGGNTTQTVPVTITDDTDIEGTETFIFQLVNPSAGLILGSTVFDTLRILDNDFLIDDIMDYTTNDMTGSPDSLGATATFRAVVLGINYADLPDVSFYINDITGGIGVFDATGSTGYAVNEGDEIEIRGEIGFFNGLTQLVNIDFINVVGSASLPTPIGLLGELEEGSESSLVSLSNVVVTDQSEWNTGVGAGFNVEVTKLINGFTYSIRVDRSTDLYNMMIPGCVLDITGIATQFDNSAPYTSGYQILPRYTADITVLDTCATIITPNLTIADLTEVNAVGDPIEFGRVVTVKGIITSPDFRVNQGGTEFTFSDGTGGIWAYSTDSSITFNPVVGDSVEVFGNIGAANGVTRLFITSVTSLGVATAFSPVIVTTALNESHEAELITIENLTLNGTWNSSGGSYNVSATSDGGVTYDIRVDADRAELYTVPLTGNNKFNLTGVGSQFDSSAPRTEGYTIMPRFESDIEITVAIRDIQLNNFSLSPVPAKNTLIVSFDFDAAENANLELVDMMGRTVTNNTVNLVNGFNTSTINVASFSTGIYVLRITTSKGVSSANIIVE